MRKFTIHYICTDGVSVHREHFWGYPSDLQKHAELMLKELSSPEMAFVRFYYTEILASCNFGEVCSEEKKLKQFVVVYKNLPQFKGCDEYVLSSKYGSVAADLNKAERFTLDDANRFALKYTLYDQSHGSAEVVEVATVES